MQELTKGVDIVYHCAATAHEGLSVFSPNFIAKNNYMASCSIITASIINKVKKKDLFFALQWLDTVIKNHLYRKDEYKTC